jgi:hypothetical protein
MKEPRIVNLALCVERWKSVCVCVTVKLQFTVIQANVEKQRRFFLLLIDILW